MSDPIDREACEDAVSREDAIRWVKTECNPYGKPTLDFESGKKVIEYLKSMPPAAQSQYEELTPEEAASEIASGSTMSAWYWLDDMIRLKQMGYAICRKR